MLPKILERTAYVDELSGIPFALYTIERLYYEQLHFQSWKNLLKSIAPQENSLTTTSYPTNIMAMLKLVKTLLIDTCCLQNNIDCR